MLPSSKPEETGSTITLDIASVTEAAAVAAAHWRGRGDEAAADDAAIEAAADALNRLDAKGIIVVGEGEEDETDRLFTGQQVGSPDCNLQVDIAVDALEGTTVCAKALPNAMSVIAVAKRGDLLEVPAIYMNKIAIGPGYEEDVVDLDATPAENLGRLAEAKGVPIENLTACVLDRPRHAKLIEEIRATGAALRLIGDGDIAGVIHTTATRATGIDIYMGIGGAHEGVLAAAALACIGGQMQGRLFPANDQQRERARAAEITDINRKYRLAEMASGDVSFAATGITSGSFLEGVRFTPRTVITHTVVMRSANQTNRWVRTERRIGGELPSPRNPGRIG
ncbi:Fructose-1,6-bisphosphatase class 2 [Methyloligella halotolerans]|uniref:Fructose-1,6-bisphosphatase n=1 Tax=Methyloligella halotolerans TaxID=1177755 RepID=A0A1E2S266_9HYPH|nr:class II fructose-bisphosphatase [Methyloligella halotolerans]ODA68541.1 Fructose-1,6-bisphosphatase class 2 [Methyloligella halotolerans]